MIDIFEDLIPKVYCADVEVCALIPSRGGKMEKRVIRVKKYPITLLNDEIPSDKIRQRFFRGIFDKYIHRSEFEKIRFKILEITNKKFLSNICYKFDSTIH